MKSLFILLLIPFILVGQEGKTINFKNEDGALIWQKVYEVTTSPDSFYEVMRKSGNFSIMELFDNTITADFKEIDFKFDKNREGSLYMYTGKLTGFVQIDFKDSRYRITVKRMGVLETVDAGFFKKGDITSLETYAFKKNGDFRKGFYNRDMNPIENTIELLFKTPKTSDDW